MQKVRGRAFVYSAPTDCRRLVSDSISLPSRGSFHLSLTVLVHYRSQSVFSLGEWSPRIPTGLHGSGRTQEHRQGISAFAYGTVTFYGWLSHTILLADLLLYAGPTTPPEGGLG